MRQRHFYYVYILASLSGTLYIGMTGFLERRIFEHKEHRFAGFTSRYGVDRLVYFESFNDPRKAIRREKQLKGWTRAKKIALFERTNPHWEDLSREWYENLNRRYAAWQGRVAEFANE